ncbi:MAG: DUF2231 domain-containing protein [Acidobacteriia bacterium]|nr:DUF2231 domain-containing protein [Terriglobia bacterium]
MSPWDPRTAIFAKHAQHVVIIHFPIALLITGVALDFLATWSRRKDLAQAAYCNFCGALVTAVPAALTGLLAWQWELDGRRLKGILLLHLVSGAASLMLIVAVWWVHWRLRPGTGDSRPSYRWGLEILAVALVSMTGHLGGFLSGVNHP